VDAATVPGTVRQLGTAELMGRVQERQVRDRADAGHVGIVEYSRGNAIFSAHTPRVVRAVGDLVCWKADPEFKPGPLVGKCVEMHAEV